MSQGCGSYRERVARGGGRRAHPPARNPGSWARLQLWELFWACQNPCCLKPLGPGSVHYIMIIVRFPST